MPVPACRPVRVLDRFGLGTPDGLVHLKPLDFIGLYGFQPICKQRCTAAGGAPQWLDLIYYRIPVPSYRNGCISA